MKQAVVFAVVAIVFVASPAAAQSDAKVQQGAALFTAEKCTMCHSFAGKGNSKGALDNITAKNKAEYIREWLQDPEGMRVRTSATRTPAMKPAKLTPEQIDALVAYLTSVPPAKATAGSDR